MKFIHAASRPDWIALFTGETNEINEIKEMDDHFP